MLTGFLLVNRIGKTVSISFDSASRLDPEGGPMRETWARAQAVEAYLLSHEGRGWRATCNQFTLLRRTTLFRPVNTVDTDRGGGSP